MKTIMRIGLVGILIGAFWASYGFAMDCGKKLQNCQKKVPAPAKQNAPATPAQKPQLPPKAEAQGPKDMVIVFDVTGSTDAERDANQKCFIRIANGLYTGDGFAAISATDLSFTNPEHLINYHVLPLRAGQWEIELKRAKARICHEFVQKIKAMPIERPATSLIDAVHLGAQMLSEGLNPRKVLVVISDMREHRKQLNEDTILQRGDEVLSQFRADGHIPHLAGVEVFCMGVSTVGMPPHAWGKLRDFWSKFFASAGASLRSYDVGRHRQIN